MESVYTLVLVLWVKLNGAVLPLYEVVTTNLTLRECNLMIEASADKDRLKCVENSI